MMNRIVLFLFYCFLAIQLNAQGPILSPRTANYDMDIRLDVEKKKVFGKTRLVWNNPSTDTVEDLQFHLYYNAFKNSESTFFKERGIPEILAKNLEEDCEWSWVNIQSMVDDKGNNLIEGFQYIQPDDDNDSDQTVLQVLLAEPVGPKGTITIDFEWTSRIPKTMIRTGYNRDYYFMAQWFPKVGVYEPAGLRYAEEGQWNCHQYHSSGEYYSDFGVYNVNITVPENFVVGASGLLINQEKNNENQTWSFQAKDVIDFTWSTSPHFVERKAEVSGGVDVRILTYPEHEHFSDRYFKAIDHSIEYLEKYVGDYPYPNLTIIDPPFHGIFTSGMEYPTLITTGSTCLFPKGVMTAQTLAVHELIHQYFMQMVATHEVEEPWLDEGFTTYYEGRIMDHYYDDNKSAVDFLGIQFGNIEYNRAGYLAGNPMIAPNSSKSWEFKHEGYGAISYNKTGVWLKTLEGMVGIESMDEIMQTYFERWKFKHPCGRDFIAIVNEIVSKNHGVLFGENMNWFFDQVIYGTETCDYDVAGIYNEIKKEPRGVFDDDCIQIEEKEEGDEGIIYINKTVLHRLGGLKLPVDVRIVFENGNKEYERWDGIARSTEFVYETNSKIVSVEIDPDRKIYLDKNFINNSLTTKQQKTGMRKYVSKFMLYLQSVMQSVSLLI